MGDDMGNTNNTRPLKGKSLLCFPDSYVVIDIETTGLSPAYEEIIELAALKVENGKPVSSFQELVYPRMIVSPFIESLTGITNNMLKNARPIEEVINDFISFTGTDTIIVGHNVNFDINFIYDKLMRTDGRAFSNDFVDTLRLARKYLPQLSHRSLGDLTEYFSIEVKTAHRALADCFSTYEVLEKIKML